MTIATSTSLHPSRLLALKINVSTWRGTTEGVPTLLSMLQAHHANATFFWNVGKDQTGRALRRGFRAGFMQRGSRLSAFEHYGLKTMLYGTFLPAPDIGQRGADIMRSVRDAGFEVGVQCWNRIRWQDSVMHQPPEWIHDQMQHAVERYTQIFGEAPRVHGAASWQMNWEAYRVQQSLGFEYASDSRGHTPFIPMNRGELVLVPQIPTTLPTLDELIGVDGLSANNVHEHLLKLTVDAPETGHVYTLNAELEGQKLAVVFERLLHGWREQGYTFVSLQQLVQHLDLAHLPHYEVETRPMTERRGVAVTAQGARVF